MYKRWFGFGRGLLGWTGCLTYLWVEKGRKSLSGHSWEIKRFKALSRPHTIGLMPEQDIGSIFSLIFDPKNCLKSARYDAQSDALLGVTTFSHWPPFYLFPARSDVNMSCSSFGVTTHYRTFSLWPHFSLLGPMACSAFGVSTHYRTFSLWPPFSLLGPMSRLGKSPIVCGQR